MEPSQDKEISPIAASVDLHYKNIHKPGGQVQAHPQLTITKDEDLTPRQLTRRVADRKRRIVQDMQSRADMQRPLVYSWERWWY